MPLQARREGIWNFIFAFLLRAMAQSQNRSWAIAPAAMTSFAAPPPPHHHHLPSLFFHEHESITLAPAPSLHNTVIVRLESVTTVLQEDANKSNNNTTTTTTTRTTPFPQTIRQFMLDYGVSRLFLSTGSSSSSSSSYNHDLLHDEYTLGPSGISLVLEMHDQFTNNLQSSSLLEALESSRLLSFLAPWNHVLHHPAPLHRHVYTRRLSPTLVRMQVILPSLDGSAAAAVALEGVREFFSSSSNCDGGMFAPHSSKDYSSILLGDSQTIQVSQTIRRSMWMDVQQQLSCQTTTTRQDANEKEEQSVSEDDSSCCRRIVLKRGIQYGVVVVDAAAAASSPNGWNNSQVNKQEEETRTAIPLSKLLLPFQNDCGHCDNTNNNNNNKTTTTRLSILQVASTTPKNDNPNEDESMEVNEYTIMDWNVDNTTVDLNFVPTTLSSLLGHQNYSNNRRLEANRILSRPNGVANTGTIVTTIQSSLTCPVTVQVMEILPPILLPRWDTWTIVSTTKRTTTTTKPLLTFQSDGTIVVEYNVTLNPMTTINMTLDYEPALLPFQQFPADANRGIELPPTLFTFGNNNDASTCTNSSSITATTTTTTLYSAPLLFMPPVPDMSMPFNVVSLTCTLYAFIVGSVANLLVRKASRRIQCRLLHPEEDHKSKLQRVKEKLLQCNLTRIFQKKRVHHDGGDAAVAIGNETEDKRNANVEHKEVSSTANEEESKMD